MKIKSRFLIPIFFVLFCYGFEACKKDAGEGGTSTIKGKIIVHQWDKAFFDSLNVDTFPSVDENVFIIYGADHSTYNDDYKTTYDGSYEFKYLQKGKYKIFAYSKDTTGAHTIGANSDAPKVPVFAEVEITSNGSTVTAPDITILDTR